MKFNREDALNAFKYIITCSLITATYSFIVLLIVGMIFGGDKLADSAAKNPASDIQGITEGIQFILLLLPLLVLKEEVFFRLPISLLYLFKKTRESKYTKYVLYLMCFILSVIFALGHVSEGDLSAFNLTRVFLVQFPFAIFMCYIFVTKGATQGEIIKPLFYVTAVHYFHNTFILMISFLNFI